MVNAAPLHKRTHNQWAVFFEGTLTFSWLDSMPTFVSALERRYYLITNPAPPSLKVMSQHRRGDGSGREGRGGPSVRHRRQSSALLRRHPEVMSQSAGRYTLVRRLHKRLPFTLSNRPTAFYEGQNTSITQTLNSAQNQREHSHHLLLIHKCHSFINATLVFFAYKYYCNMQ